MSTFPEVPFRRVFQPIKRPVPPDAEMVTAFTDGTVTLRRNRRLDGYHQAADMSGYRGVASGDFVVHGLDILKGSAGVSDSDGAITSVCTVCLPRVDADSRYFGYVIRAQASTGLPRALARGVREGGADFRRWDTLAELPLPLPTRATQSAIADFLDRETERIDGLVEKKRRLIDLLEEKRTALISRAVTKGLDPTVPMKESGVPWLSAIPSHWEPKRLKFALSRLIDTEHKTVHFVDDGEHPVIRTSDVRRGALLVDQAKRTDRAGYLEWTRRGRPREGDILLSREAPAGEAALVPSGCELCLGQRMVLVRPDPAQLLSRFLVHWLYSPPVGVFIDLVSQGSTVRHLNMSDIPNIPVLCPPSHEQQLIAGHCDAINAQTSALEDRLHEQLDKLAEYRQALITAAVTGQIDVAAEAAAPEEVVA